MPSWFSYILSEETQEFSRSTIHRFRIWDIDADDLLMMSYIKLQKRSDHVSSLRDEARRRYIWSTIKRTAIDHVRKRNRFDECLNDLMDRQRSARQELRQAAVSCIDEIRDLVNNSNFSKADQEKAHFAIDKALDLTDCKSLAESKGVQVRTSQRWYGRGIEVLVEILVEAEYF